MIALISLEIWDWSFEYTEHETLQSNQVFFALFNDQFN